MKREDFQRIEHFTMKEIPGWDKMKFEVIKRLDEMRHGDGEAMKWYFIITSAYREGKPGVRYSYHHDGMAIDGMMIDRKTHLPLPLPKQFIIAERWGWGGIGLYPFWARPGLHLDIRPYSEYDRHARWYRDRNGNYGNHLDYLELRGLFKEED